MDHLTREELAAFLRTPEAAGGRRVVRHLSLPCADCWATLAGLEGPPEAAGPVAMALGEWLGLARGAEGDDALDRLRPAHRAALRGADREPLGLCRLVVERGRELALADPGRATRAATAALEVLADPPLAALAPQVCHDLLALGHAYLADAHLMAADHPAAEAAFRAAFEELAQGSGDPKVAAAVGELEADLAIAQRRFPDALGRLARCQELVRPGDEREAEILVRRGFVLLQLDDVPAARGLLRRARSLVRPGRNPRLRLTVLHNLAAAEVRSDELEAAGAILAEAEPLYAEWGDDLTRCQRLWLLGVIHLHRRQPDEAERLLRTALDGFLELGFGFDAARVLLDLGRLCVVTERSRELADLEALFQELLRGPEFRRFVMAELRKLLELALRDGRSIPHLAEMIARLEAQSG